MLGRHKYEQIGVLLEEKFVFVLHENNISMRECINNSIYTHLKCHV